MSAVGHYKPHDWLGLLHRFETRDGDYLPNATVMTALLAAVVGVWIKVAVTS